MVYGCFIGVIVRTFIFFDDFICFNCLYYSCSVFWRHIFGMLFQSMEWYFGILIYFIPYLTVDFDYMLMNLWMSLLFSFILGFWLIEHEFCCFIIMIHVIIKFSVHNLTPMLFFLMFFGWLDVCIKFESIIFIFLVVVSGLFVYVVRLYTK